MAEILRWLVSPQADLGDEDWAVPVDEALAGGHRADRLGYAFAAGYRAALRALCPDLPRGTRAALCATEEGGVMPRAIAATLTPAPASDGGPGSDVGDGGYRLAGHKKFASLASEADLLLVVAREGLDAEGRPRLRVARVPVDRPGITLLPQPPLPFAPEIGHAEVRLHDVAVGAHELLPGDGWSRYLRPFRTVEDIHVHAALTGYLLRLARDAAWPQGAREQLLGVALSLRSLATAAAESADDPALHVALAGVLASSEALRAQLQPHFALVDEETRLRFTRDAPLLRVASSARARRIARAWERIAIE